MEKKTLESPTTIGEILNTLERFGDKEFADFLELLKIATRTCYDGCGEEVRQAKVAVVETLTVKGVVAVPFTPETAQNPRKMRLNISKEWLLKTAENEADCDISVGFVAAEKMRMAKLRESSCDKTSSCKSHGIVKSMFHSVDEQPIPTATAFYVTDRGIIFATCEFVSYEAFRNFYRNHKFLGWFYQQDLVKLMNSQLVKPNDPTAITDDPFNPGTT